MGRFAWTQGHSKQPSDKSSAVPDWFSKTSGEPSRQALSELMKEHSNSPPGSTRTRSRTNTVSSVPSREANSADQSSTGPTTRPASQQSIMEETQVSPPRHDRLSKAFLSKSTKMMRRQTSKLNMLGSHGDDGRSSGISRVRSAGHLLSLHSKRTEVRPQISGPYDFQHVSHTNKGQYETLNQTNKTDLADSFTAMQADQQPGQDIKGIPVSDLPSSTPAIGQAPAPPPQSPTFSIVPSLPNTPPKPAPPPKDHLRLPSLGGDVRFSRSMDNFSWPTRSPQLEFDSFQSDMSSDLAGEEHVTILPSAPASPGMPVGESGDVAGSVPTSPGLPNHTHMTAEMLDKPLPQPPTIVHAVSTSDDSTLMMKVAPLPQVPNSQADSPKSQHLSSTPTSPKALSDVRPLQPLRPHRLSRRRSQSSSDFPLASNFMSAAGVLTSPPRNVRQSKRISIGIKKIDIDDWEDAIDYSWDHAFDGEDEMGLEFTKSDILPQTSSFGAQRASSALQLSSLAPTAGPMRPYKSDLDLQGLGIESVRPQSEISAVPEYEEYSEKHESLKVPFARREPGSPISKSSSQESIILSIASSIMSTHRSSNSSTSLGDMSQLESIEDEGALPLEECKTLARATGSVSSSETVTTDKKSPAPVDEDKLEELPAIAHQRGASASRVPFVPNRTSSVASAGKSATRQRSSTLNSGRRVNPRASYSLFPVAGPAAPAN